MLGWAFLPNLGSGSLVGDDGGGGFDNDYKGAQPALKVTLVLGSAPVALVQDLTHVTWGSTQQVPLFKVFIYAFGCGGS